MLWLRLLGFGKFLAEMAGELLHWLLADWKRMVILVLLCIAGWQHVTLKHVRADLAAANAATAREKAAHEQTVRDYREASRRAQEAAQANVERVRAEQERITNRVTQDYRTRIADSRAVADRLRARAASNSSGPDATGVPSASDPASGITDPPADAILTTIDTLETCELQAVQLDALITWVTDQSAVAVVPD